MGSEILSNFTRVLEIFITALVSIAGTYFALRGKLRDAQAQEEIARIQNEDDLMTAFAGLQSDWASTYRQLVADVSGPMEQARAEIGLLRVELQKANDEISKLRTEVKALQKENKEKEQRIRKLETNLETEKRLTERLREKMNQMKSLIDTGPFPSGPHKIPKDGE